MKVLSSKKGIRAKDSRGPGVSSGFDGYKPLAKGFKAIHGIA